MESEVLWLSIKNCERIYGLKRSFIYSRIKTGEIVSRAVSVRKRLISKVSIEEFINSSDR